MPTSMIGFHNLFSLASRERCMINFKKFRVPFTKTTKVPSGSAAVLIPMCRVNEQPTLLYTVRSTKLNSHSGQISFPGGKTDEGETPVETALRETREEIGLSSSKIDIWGYGPSFPGKDFKVMITPIIAYVPDFTVDDLKINEEEVSEVLAVPIHILCDPSNQYHTQFRNGFVLPVFLAENYKIWGITAYITHVFLTCLLPKHMYRNEWMKKRITLDEDWEQ
ncbi:unnamed protein product [Pieris macdunnoughi]|uniref:Nudix hydrolase domain-containing protein n=1 Tax=Pieris macdunnoughi TaxID=345717 RepID=A0A821U0Z1_9NEOP|nr:unnamed protein product [Pieris macdunnoughi]